MSLSLSQSDCKFILASSDTIDDLIDNVADYGTLSINIQQNCCGAIQSVEIDPISTTSSYSLILPTSSLILRSIIWLDVSTGIKYTQGLGNTVVTSCSEITTYLTSISGISDNFTYGCDIAESNFAISFVANSTATVYVPYSLTYSLSSAPSVRTVVSFLFATMFFVDNKLAISYNILPNVSLFEDSVYSINLTFIKTTGSTTISQSGCIFVDCVTKCRVASAISISSGQIVTDLLLYHYGLSFSQDCMCDCAYLCNIYDILNNLLNSIIPNTTINECGCA